MTDLIKFFKEVGKLKKTVRTGWKVAGVKDPESVAEHTYRLTMLCMVLADKFGVDGNKLVKMALIDDLAEALTSDLVQERGDRTIMDKGEKLNKERVAISKIFANLEDGNKYLDLWEEGQNGESRESQILKQLDKLEMVMQALDYEGETESEKLDEFWINTKKHLKEPALVEIFEELLAQRKRKPKT